MENGKIVVIFHQGSTFWKIEMLRNAYIITTAVHFWPPLWYKFDSLIGSRTIDDVLYAVSRWDGRIDGASANLNFEAATKGERVSAN